MAAHTSWASEALALNQTAAFKVEDAASAEVALDNEFLGFGLPRIVRAWRIHRRHRATHRTLRTG